MAKPTRRDYRDANEPEIMATLENCGAAVFQISGRAGVPDLLVGFMGKWILVEVKNPDGRNRTHADQDGFFTLCEYRGLPAYIIRTSSEAEQLLGELAANA